MLDFGDNIVPGLNVPFAQTTICGGLGPSTMSPIVSLDRYFRDEIAGSDGPPDTWDPPWIPVAAPGGGGR